MTFQRILVTGAAGLIGRQVCRHLRGQGHAVRAVDLHPGKEDPVEIADLLLRESAFRVTEGVDAVVHLANWPNLNRTTNIQVMVENTTMNTHVFQAVIERKIKHVVYASSIQAMSGHISMAANHPAALAYLPLDGDVPANPSNAYGVSKATGEVQCRWLAASHGVAASAIRFPWVMERKRSPERARQMMLDKRHAKYMHADEGFLCMHVADAARLVECVLLRHVSGYRCVQGGSFDHCLPNSVDEIIATYYPNIPCRQPRESLRSLCDLAVLERDFGFVPQESAWKTPEEVAADVAANVDHSAW